MSTSSRNGRISSASRLILAAAALTPLAWRQASATTYQWIGGTSDWNNAANWTPSGGPPGDGDTANVTSSLGLTQTVTYDETGFVYQLTGLDLNLTGGNGINGEMLSIAANTLSCAIENVGGFADSPAKGVGTIDQSGGENLVNDPIATLGVGGLTLGYNVGDDGFYNLSGGTLLSEELAAEPILAYYPPPFPAIETVGLSGVGVFNQTGGTNLLTPARSGDAAILCLGSNAGSTGTYILSGSASLTVTGTEFVGFGGVGVFNQTGGTNTLIQPGSVNDDRDAGVLSICVNYGGTGTYNLSGGSLTAAGVVIDAEVGLGYGDEFDGVGVLNVSGGSLNTGTLEVGRPQLLGSSQAIMTLTGGVVTASDLTVNGQLNDQAGSLTAASATIDLGSMTVDGAANCATITLGYIGTLTVNGVLTSGNTVVVGILPGFSPQGGTLDGAGNGSTTGFVANVLLITGVIQPGNSVSAIGTLTAQSLTASGGTIQSNFAASSGVGRNSELIVQGTASFAGPATFNVSAPTAAAFPVGTYALLTSTGLNAGQPLASGGVAPGFLPTFDLPASAARNSWSIISASQTIFCWMFSRARQII